MFYIKWDRRKQWGPTKTKWRNSNSMHLGIPYFDAINTFCPISILSLLMFLEIMGGSNTTQQNWFVRWRLSPFLNTLSCHLLSDVRLLTDVKICLTDLDLIVIDVLIVWNLKSLSTRNLYSKYKCQCFARVFCLWRILQFGNISIFEQINCISTYNYKN